jgi:GTP:adenosylcobinamide-phosphate guanylyltransferase
MQDATTQLRSVILAGERPGGSPLSKVFGVSASVMVPVAGKPSLAYVMDAIEASQLVGGGVICGPTTDALNKSPKLKSLLQHPDFEWLEQATGPAASALAAMEELDDFPALLTAGDHALLTPEIVDDFCAQALSVASGQPSEKARPDSNSDLNYDLIIGFVPYTLVRAAWPKSKRTVTKFSNGQYCGSNLFAILTPEGKKALSFWRQAEADRKQPWRIARRFGYLALLRYVFRRLTLEDALQALSKAAGCRIGHVEVKFARAAVDVDSVEDQKLAEQILTSSF